MVLGAFFIEGIKGSGIGRSRATARRRPRSPTVRGDNHERIGRSRATARRRPRSPALNENGPTLGQGGDFLVQVARQSAGKGRRHVRRIEIHHDRADHGRAGGLRAQVLVHLDHIDT